MKPVLTEEQKQFIKDNRLSMSGVDMAKKFGVSKSVVQVYIRKNNLTPPKEIVAKFKSLPNVGKTSSTPKVDKYLNKNYLTEPIKAIASNIGKSATFVKKRLEQLGLEIPKEIIEQRMEVSKYKKGNIPNNKGKKISPQVYEKLKPTMFKKGQSPHNSLSIGAETIRTDRRTGNSYIMIKVENKPKLIYKHIHIWEKINGKVTKGYNIVFINKNSLDCRIENLECISNAELMERNTIHQYPPELKELIKLNNKVKKKVNEKQCRKSKKHLI